MQIYLLRHGIAETHAPSGSDADRALTGEGRLKLRQVVKAAARCGVAPTLILSSPYVRAVETARIAVEGFGYPGEVVRTRALTPGGNPTVVWDELRTHRDQSEILLVGHEPLFSALGAYLLGVPELNIDFKKGALLAIEISGFGAVPRGTLRWLLTARLAG